MDEQLGIRRCDVCQALIEKGALDAPFHEDESGCPRVKLIPVAHESMVRCIFGLSRRRAASGFDAILGRLSRHLPADVRFHDARVNQGTGAYEILASSSEWEPVREGDLIPRLHVTVKAEDDPTDFFQKHMR